jgi:hypothetical protein
MSIFDVAFPVPVSLAEDLDGKSNEAQWSEAIVAGTSSNTKELACNVLNTHVNRTISGSVEIIRSSREGVAAIGGARFVEVQPGAVSSVGVGGPNLLSGWYYCRVVLDRQVNTDHANSKHVRASFVITDYDDDRMLIPLR